MEYKNLMLVKNTIIYVLRLVAFLSCFWCWRHACLNDKFFHLAITGVAIQLVLVFMILVFLVLDWIRKI